MTNSEELRALIARKGLKLNYIAERLSITPVALTRKIENKNEFKQGEIAKLCDVLDIKSLSYKERIFFAG
jgi:transcriptional regulator with XRE-family HTH domain